MSTTGSNPNKANDNPKAGPGRPLGSTNKVSIKAQLGALDTSLGVPFEEHLAQTLRKLYDSIDWDSGKNLKEYLHLVIHLSNKLTQSMPQEVKNTNTNPDMSDSAIKNAIKERLIKLGIIKDE